MEDVVGKSFSLHTAKTWKKNKGKRLVRSIAKKNRAGDRRDNATVALYVIKDDSEDDEEVARRKKEKEDREDRNKKWREKKEKEERGDQGPQEKKKVDKDTRNRMMDKELRCRNCRDNLDAEVWECPGGHGFCGDCVDKEHLGDNPAFEEDEAEMGSDGIFRNKGLESLKRIVNNEASEDTLWLCTKDDDEESVTLTETTGNKEESTFWRFKKKVESKLSSEASVDLIPKTLSQIEEGGTEQKDDEELHEDYEADLQKNIQTMDFFDTGTSTKKTNISGYGDYNRNNREVFASYSIDEEEWNKGYQVQNKGDRSDSSSESGSSNYSTDTELEISPVTKCPVCSLGIERRNAGIEKIAVLFNTMMRHRMKI